MGKIKVLATTPINPISLMGERAGVCWGADITDEGKNYKRGISCIKSGHHRVMEYVGVDMIIDGYSARVIREWYTHIGGAPTRLQASTRYIDYSNFEYIEPPKIAANTQAHEIYQRAMVGIYHALTDLEEIGIPKEDSALLLPLGMTTKIVDHRNLRNLIEMSHQRLCTRAYWEYRQLMRDIMAALKDYSPEWALLVNNYFVPKCEATGKCTEANGCGKTPKQKGGSVLQAARRDYEVNE